MLIVTQATAALLLATYAAGERPIGGTMRKLAAILCLAVAWSFAPGAADDCETAQLDCLPTPEQCAAGDATGVWLGRYVGSAAACAGAGGTTLAYIGGNAAIPCGAIIVANTPAVDGDPRFCDEDITFPQQLRFRVQLPADYETSGKRYPVLYLLPGGGADENDWFQHADIPSLADMGVIIVVPYNGVSFYVDWHDGSIKAETAYIGSLIPLIDGTYRTRADRAHRAVAGFSQGGGGALIWAARHPDLFSVAGSFSGIADFTLTDPFGDVVLGAQMASLATYRDPAKPNPVFGDPITDAVWWHNINPADMVTSLRSVDLWLSCGTGAPAPGETDPATIAFSGFAEADLYLRNISLTRALDAAGVPYEFRAHRGTHGVYAAQDLYDWFPWMLQRFGAADPTTFDYRTVEPAFKVWGWRVRADAARAPEFLDMTDVTATSATFTGSGLTTATTPPLFAPGATVSLTGATTPAAVAADDGTITFTVDLGAPHTLQEFTLPAIALEAAGGYFTTKTVSFS